MFLFVLYDHAFLSIIVLLKWVGLAQVGKENKEKPYKERSIFAINCYILGQLIAEMFYKYD